jgi:hypothetical protein
MSDKFNQQALGTGNAAETVFNTNGTIVVPPRQTLNVTDYILDFQGAGIIRIRETDITGAIKMQRRIAADGEIISDLKTPLFLENADLLLPKNFVITYQGAFACAAFFAGQFDR